MTSMIDVIVYPALLAAFVDHRRRAFSVMLTASALHYYYDVVKPSAHTLEDIIVLMRTRFRTKERTLALS